MTGPSPTGQRRTIGGETSSRTTGRSQFGTTLRGGRRTSAREPGAHQMFPRSPRVRRGLAAVAVVAALASLSATAGAANGNGNGRNSTTTTTSSTTTTEATTSEGESTSTTEASTTLSTDGNRTFSVDVDGDPDGLITAEFTNTSRNNQTIGAIRLVVPIGLSVDQESISVDGNVEVAVLPTGTVITVDVIPNLERRAKATLSFDVSRSGLAVCSTQPYEFLAFAKQANDFNGTGNDFLLTQADLTVETPSSGCELRFVAEPTDAISGEVVTSEPFTPGGEPVRVGLYEVDGGLVAVDDGTVALTLVELNGQGEPSGGLTSDLDGGIAAFEPIVTLTDGAVGSFQLTASLGSLTDTSTEFRLTIWDDVTTIVEGPTDLVVDAISGEPVSCESRIDGPGGELVFQA
ncbi:MAG TPA: hypothetical protein VK866_13305, partial [Acidimicrobiales bacterium]|nr:hypothetical protein [Acidimicrobiales bacterium]